MKSEVLLQLEAERAEQLSRVLLEVISHDDISSAVATLAVSITLARVCAVYAFDPADNRAQVPLGCIVGNACAVVCDEAPEAFAQLREWNRSLGDA